MLNKIRILDLPTICDAYRASIFIVDFENRISAQFVKQDHEDQRDFVMNNINKRKQQGELFSSIHDFE